MTKIVKGLGFINRILIILATIIVTGFSYVYKRFIGKTLETIFDKIIILLLETLDNDYNGILIFFIFLMELFILLIIPWFFSWKIGIIIISYLLITLIFIFYLVIKDVDSSNWKITLLIFWIIPYLTMTLFPTAIITITKKKEKSVPTIIQLRKTKLKYLRKKIRINKLKVWNK
jgi:hypothetical protein